MLAVVFDYVFRQRTRICDDNKMTISLTAVSVDDAYLPPLYFKFVELSLSLSLSTRLSDESLSIIHHSVLQRDAADQGHTGMALYIHQRITTFTKRKNDSGPGRQY